MTCIDEIERAGYVASIYHDEDAESPASWCNVGTLAYDTRSASCGDMPSYWRDYGLESLIPADATLCLPVYAYDDRNGTVLHVSDWERANGWIYATDACACGCGSKHGMDSVQLRAALESKLNVWQQWAQGDVYGVVVKSPSNEEVDACWGFYGLEYAEEEAARMLDIEEVHMLERHPNLAKMVIS